MAEQPTTKRNLSQQIEEVARELALRSNVYPGLVQKRKLKRAQADEHMARMEAVMRTLNVLNDNNVPADIPRPADMLGALIRIRLHASETRKQLELALAQNGDDITSKTVASMMRDIVDLVERTFGRIPLPELVDDNKAKALVKFVHDHWANQDMGHEAFRVTAGELARQTLS